MNTLEKEIEELKKKHAQLELDSYNEKLKEKYEKLKLLENTVEVRIVKMSKTSRYVCIVHHISYKMKIDDWKRETEFERNYIGQHLKMVTIHESLSKSYPKYNIDCIEITPTSYNGKIHAKEETNSFDYATHKTITVDEFNTIWSFGKTAIKNVLDGMLDIKEIKWLMNGTDEDFEFKESELIDAKKANKLDIKHILLSQEESWILNNKFTRLFLNHNIFLITPNSLEALDEWFLDQKKSDEFSYSACASVGERWRGSRMNEYEKLVTKIKSV